MTEYNSKHSNNNHCKHLRVQHNITEYHSNKNYQYATMCMTKHNDKPT